MVQSAKSWTGGNFRLLKARTDSFSAAGCFFVQAQVRSIFVVVLEVVSQQPLKMLLVEHDDLIEQVSATTAYKAFGNTVPSGVPKMSKGSGSQIVAGRNVLRTTREMT
jgi:hypothetical protein